MKARLRLAGTVLLLFALVAGCTFYWNPLWVNDRQIRYHLWRAGVRSEIVNVRGDRIHYFEAVPPDGTPGKPLLLLHGLGSRGEDWAPLIPSLAAAGFHVYAPDLLGYGRSDKPVLSAPSRWKKTSFSTSSRPPVWLGPTVLGVPRRSTSPAGRWADGSPPSLRWTIPHSSTGWSSTTARASPSNRLPTRRLCADRLGRAGATDGVVDAASAHTARLRCARHPAQSQE